MISRIFSFFLAIRIRFDTLKLTMIVHNDIADAQLQQLVVIF